MIAVLQEPRALTKAETLRQYEYKARAAMHRMRSASFEIAAAQIDVGAGEDSVGSGLRSALLDYQATRSKYLDLMRNVSRLRGEVGR